MSHPVCYTIQMIMKEMREMDKAFEDFSKACDNAIGKCQDFIEMDINKTSEPTLEKQREQREHNVGSVNLHTGGGRSSNSIRGAKQIPPTLLILSGDGWTKGMAE